MQKKEKSVPHQIIVPAVDILGTPDNAAPRGKFETQLVFGEFFLIEEEKNGWSKGACAHDGYAGYVESRCLAKPTAPATHIVTAARSLVYHEASIKSPLLNAVSFGSLITITATDKDWARLSNGAWIYQKHIAPVDAPDKDHVATARKFLETPYYWGGRSGFGIDCSGLVQVCLARAGIKAPRDTEDQEKAIGTAADEHKAGDIIFLPGHVGIMADGENLIHASSFHMKVMIEPLGLVTKRHEGITAVRRV
jgi:cell wall-associated NlpC family hydrolase